MFGARMGGVTWSHREVAKPAPLPSALEITPCHAGGTRDESKSSQLYVQSTLSIISSVTVNQGLKHDETVYGRLDPIQTAMRDEKHASPSGPRPLLSMGDHGFRAEDHEHSVFCSTSFLTAAATSAPPTWPRFRMGVYQCSVFTKLQNKRTVHELFANKPC